MSDILDSVGSDGAGIDLDGAPSTFNYNGDGTLNYIQVVSGGNNYRQSWTWVDGRVSAVTGWVKQ